MNKRIIAVFIAAIMIIQYLSFVSVFADDRNLTLEKVREMAIEESNGVESAQINLIKKEIELKQAKEGIRDIRKKESTVGFSLLFNITLPSSHAMPKEIDLLTKVPQLEKEIRVLNKQVLYEKLKSQTEGETAYYNVILEDYKVVYLESRIKDTTKLLADVEKNYRIGTAKKADVEYVETQLNKFQKELEKSILTADNNKKKLGKIIGVENLNLGYTFSQDIEEAFLTRSQLTEIQSYALENDFELLKKSQDRQLAESDVETILSVYNSKYSKYMADIESYIRVNEGGKIDYTEFIRKYNHTLTAIDAPWDGAFVINLLFFKIEIPKEWFKLEYSGTRYMEDQKYALFVALTDRDAARKDENDQKSSLETTIDDAYMTIKEMEQSLQLSKENLEKSQANYELQLNQNKIGLVDFSTLQTARESLYEQETALFEMQIEYGKTLSNFNLQTSGFVNKLLGRAETTINEYEAGQTTGDKASWFVKNNITEYNFTFGVQIPENYGVDEFQLFYGNSPIGEKTKISETLIHTYVSFGNTEELSLKFFTGGVETYKSTIIGNDYEGELNLIKVAEAPISASVVENVNNLGTWSLVDLDSFRSEFYANFNNINVDFDSIQISYKDKTLTTINKNTSYSTLKLYFSTPADLTLILMKDGQAVKNVYIKDGADGKILTEEK